jgi:16S rRNA (guanine527-N7)-methyltransferase
MYQPIEDHFQLNDSQRQQIAALDQLYKNLNSKINLISRQDIGNLYIHHVLHSLAIAKAVQFLPAARILDLGTGGGFPGIPLAILFPQADFWLLDSIAKKVKAVSSVVTELGLTNVQTLTGRAENLQAEFDFVVCRAVGRLDLVWQWAAPLIKTAGCHQIANGLLYLRGSDLADDLPASVQLKRWELDSFFEEPYFKHKALFLLSAG